MLTRSTGGRPLPHTSDLILPEWFSHTVVVVTMKPARVRLCAYCIQLASKDTAQTTIRHWCSLATLRTSSKSCHCCFLIHAMLAERSSKAHARFQFSELELEGFPLTISSSFCQNSADEIHSKTVTATLKLPNEFSYPVDLTIASCPSHCKTLSTSCCPYYTN